MKYKLSTIHLLLLIQLTLCFHGPLNYNDQSHWPDLCPIGTHQSPINLPLQNECIQSSNYFSFKQINYTSLNNKHLEYVNEYTFQLDTSDNGYIEVDIHNKTYKYKIDNIHFHLNSEHTFNNKLFSSEMHLVHILDPSLQSTSTEEEYEYNKYLVIGIIFEPKEGNTINPFFQELNFNSLSNVNNLKWDFFLNDNSNYYYYHGSLTTPTCAEQVNWIIIDNIYPISHEQFNSFKTHIGKTYPQGNNRHIQNQNGRNIYYIIHSKDKSTTALYIISIIILTITILYVMLWCYYNNKHKSSSLNEEPNIYI